MLMFLLIAVAAWRFSFAQTTGFAVTIVLPASATDTTRCVRTRWSHLRKFPVGRITDTTRLGLTLAAAWLALWDGIQGRSICSTDGPDAMAIQVKLMQDGNSGGTKFIHLAG